MGLALDIKHALSCTGNQFLKDCTDAAVDIAEKHNLDTTSVMVILVMANFNTIKSTMPSIDSNQVFEAIQAMQDAGYDITSALLATQAT